MRGYLSESRRRPKTYKPKPPVSVGPAKCLRVSEKALLIRIGLNGYWVPQSAIDAESEVYAFGHEGTLVVKHWWAARNGLVPKPSRATGSRASARDTRSPGNGTKR